MFAVSGGAGSRPRSTILSAGSGIGGLSGAFTNSAGGGAVTKGNVGVYNTAGTTLLYILPVDGSGNYAKADLTPGTYRLRAHGGNDWCLGPSEPDYHDVTISAGSPTVQNFVMQSSYWSTTFQQPGSSANVVSSTIPPASTSPFFGFPNATFVAPSGTSGQAINGTIDLDATGGPDGLKTMRYIWPDRSSIPYTDPAHSIALKMDCQGSSFPGAGESEMHLRWYGKVSANWRTGGSGVTGSGGEYKWLFFNFGTAGVGNSQTATVQIEAENRNAGGVDDLIGIRMKLFNNNSGPATDGLGPIFDYAPPRGDLLNVWDCWVLSLTGIGSGTTTATLWRNDVAILTLSDVNLGAGNFITGNCGIEFGTTMSTGPDQIQQRWWRQAGLYKRNPSRLQGLAVE